MVRDHVRLLGALFIAVGAMGVLGAAAGNISDGSQPRARRGDQESTRKKTSDSRGSFSSSWMIRR